ncbi:MAG: hypothetical protein PHY02_02145 [Phycisphaerae bacterium]|nr:hypothetical protein [Phycisphaerae bacterium]
MKGKHMSDTQTAIENRKLPSTKELDSTKEALGEILLALQCQLTAKERQELWQCFESLLAQYAEQRIKTEGSTSKPTT